MHSGWEALNAFIYLFVVLFFGPKVIKVEYTSSLKFEIIKIPTRNNSRSSTFSRMLHWKTMILTTMETDPHNIP